MEEDMEKAQKSGSKTEPWLKILLAVLLGWAGYQGWELKKFYDNLQTGMAVVGAYVSGGSLFVTIRATITNPSKTTLLIRKPFVALWAQDAEAPFAFTAPEISEPVRIPAYKDVSFDITLKAGLASSAMALGPLALKFIKTGEIKLTVKAETEILLLGGFIKPRKPDVFELSYSNKKPADKKEAAPVLELPALPAEGYAYTIEKTGIAEPETKPFSNCGSCSLSGAGFLEM